MILSDIYFKSRGDRPAGYQTQTVSVSKIGRGNSNPEGILRAEIPVVIGLLEFHTAPLAVCPVACG